MNSTVGVPLASSYPGHTLGSWQRRNEPHSTVMKCSKSSISSPREYSTAACNSLIVNGLLHARVHCRISFTHMRSSTRILERISRYNLDRSPGASENVFRLRRNSDFDLLSENCLRTSVTQRNMPLACSEKYPKGSICAS